MVSAQILVREASKGARHIVFRINLFNVTGLSFRNVHVGMSVSKSKLEDAKENDTWSFAKGRSRPFEPTIEALHCRGNDVVWYDLTLYSLRTLCVTFTVSYDNVPPETAASPEGPAGGASPHAGVADAWSDDEDETNDRLHFACQPCPLPLSIFFTPFHGFDDPANCTFPPPMVYLTCPHSHSAEMLQTGMDLQAWSPSGFHRISSRDCQMLTTDVMACFAAVAFDGESIVCFLCHQAAGGKQPSLEVRSNSQGILQDLVGGLRFWVLAGAV